MATYSSFQLSVKYKFKKKIKASIQINEYDKYLEMR